MTGWSVEDVHWGGVRFKDVLLALRRRERPRGWRGRIPQGRFNAAEKSHAIVQAALAVLFAVSGVLP